MKKSILIVVSVIVMLTFSITASAATVEDILQSLRDAGVPEVYVLQAESYMAGKTVSATIADQVIVHINNADAVAGGETKISQLTGQQKSDIFVEYAAACALLDLRAEFGDSSLTVYDESDEIVLIVTSEDAIKHTGYDYNILLYGLMLLGLSAAALIVTKKVLAEKKTKR